MSPGVSKVRYTDIARAATYGDDTQLHELLTDMRNNQPVALIETDDHRPFWALSKHADILEVERQHTLFINAPRAVLMNAEAEEALKASGMAIRSLVQMDDPDHSKFRDLTRDWFMPQNLAKVEARVEAIAAEFIDKLLATGGECDFVNDIAVWYPLRVIMMILGVPEKDEALMLKLTQELFGADDPDLQRQGVTKEERMQTIMQFFTYFTEITAQRRANPTDDVSSVIANAKIDGQAIGEIDAMSYYIIVATAGHDTTSSSTAGGLLALIQNPEQMAKLRANPKLLPSAVDEAIRWVTPVKHFMRTATVDYLLNGQEIKAGESVMMMYASANRDEDVFDGPFEFRVDRRPNRHLAFGNGAHHCLGHLLAKMEMKALYKQLLEKTSDIQLAGDPAWVQSVFVSGLKTLPIRFTPA
ncbi:MAG: cytochrome P450 [Candidatus Azotimanducaceae bacterium]|jgi:cytochrome P450